MHPEHPEITFDLEGSRVLARISTSSDAPADAFAEDRRFGSLTAALHQRGLECTVEYGLSDSIVHAALPDGSALVISPPQEPPSAHPESPEGWLVTHRRSAEPAVDAVIYDSEPDGRNAVHGRSVPHLITAVDAHLDRLGVPPRAEQERSAQEQAAATMLYRAGFVPDTTPGGAPCFRLPSGMTDLAEQRLVVTRALDVVEAEGFSVACDPRLIDPTVPYTVSTPHPLGEPLFDHLTHAIQGAIHTRDVVGAFDELTAPGDGVLHRLVDVLDATADWWDGLGETADREVAGRLRLIAGGLGTYATGLQVLRGDLADRHTAHPNKARAQADRTIPSASTSPRVSAALAPSPSRGQRAVPIRLPAESTARTALPATRPSSAPGR